MRHAWPLVSATAAAIALVVAIAAQARPRACVVPARLDDVAKTAWSLPRIAASSQTGDLGLFCSNAEEETFGPLVVRSECAVCSGPPDSWCEKSVLTVRLRPSSSLCADETPWSAPVARGSAVHVSNRVEVRGDESRGVFVAIARREFFDDGAWAPFTVDLPENPLYEPPSEVRAVTFRTETRRGFRAGRDALALGATVLAIAFTLLASRVRRTLTLLAAAATGILALALSLCVLFTSV